ncbi:MAG: SGNH/GDSL hydrolase family protein [bacterium]|nr:SGNH/GDSL hydrolase family protein [bacterium]
MRIPCTAILFVLVLPLMHADRQAIPTPMPEPTRLMLIPPPLSLDKAVLETVFKTYVRGQALGRRTDVFSKVGDSITVSYSFLYYIGLGQYQLGSADYLDPMIEAFSAEQARAGNAFTNASLAARVGWTAFSPLDPENTLSDECRPGELPLLCEYRLVRPSMAVIMFGTNDVGYVDLAAYRYNLNQIVQLSLDSGVIPILSTFPNRPGYEPRVEAFNGAVYEIAQAHHVPLIDYYAATVDLPNFGLSDDNIHPSEPPRDEATAANLRSPYLQYGYNVRNLTTLEMLYTVWWHLQQVDNP